MHRIALLLRPRFLVVALAVATLAVTGCSDPTGPLPRSGPPQSLEFNIGGFGTGSVQLRTKGDTVVFVRREWDGPSAPDTARIVPSEAAWRQFWSSTRAAGVQRWKDRYANDGIIDGTGWGLHIGLDGEDLRSQGANAYPDLFGGQRSDMTPAFLAFLGALGTLVDRDLGYGAQPEL